MEDRKLTLAEHLEELRTRIVKSFIYIILASVLAYFFVDKLIASIARPAGSLIFIAPQEAFLSNIKIALFGGAFLSSPFVLYEAWKFISKALKKKERRYALLFGPLSFVFFLAGAFFGYFIIVPIGIKFLLGFGSDSVAPMITISKYISFVGSLTFAFGTVFLLPLASAFLTKIRIITPGVLSQKRRHAVVSIFILAAVLTPPDIITQCLMAVPLMILYEIGIIFSKLVYKPV